jgi:hypothetical protein
LALQIIYRNPKRPDEAGIKIVPNERCAEAEKKALEDLGFIVISVTIIGTNGRDSSP